MKPDTDRFKAHLKYWKNRLHLGNHTIVATTDFSEVGGECEMDHHSGVATIRIGEVDEFWTEPNIARHEMLELLLEPLYGLLIRYVHEDPIYRAGHEVIHRLEQILELPTDKEVGYGGKMGCKGKKKPKGK